MAGLVDPRKRWLSAVFLGIAVLMLILGQTILANSLRGQTFIFYWLACFVFTGLAAILAMIEFFTLRRRVRRQQQEFMENAFRNVAEGKSEGQRDE